MSAKELAEWGEFYQLEPWGWEANCLLFGIVAATVANVHRNEKKKPRPFEPSDFFTSLKRPKKMDGKALKAEMRIAFAGKTNIRDKGREGDGKSPESSRPSRGVKGGRQGSEGGGKTNRRSGKAPGAC